MGSWYSFAGVRYRVEIIKGKRTPQGWVKDHFADLTPLFDLIMLLNLHFILVVVEIVPLYVVVMLLVMLLVAW